MIISDTVPWPDRLRHGQRGGRGRNFVVGAMRNPCEWYASLYAYNPYNPLKHTGAYSKVEAEAAFLPTDPVAFRRWVREIQPESWRFGLFSLKFWLY